MLFAFNVYHDLVAVNKASNILLSMKILRVHNGSNGGGSDAESSPLSDKSLGGRGGDCAGIKNMGTGRAGFQIPWQPRCDSNSLRSFLSIFPHY